MRVRILLMDGATGVERQLYILSLLAQSNRGYTLKQIIDCLKRIGISATQRMVSRDMDSISRNFFVYEEDIDGITVYKANNYAVSNMDLTMPQMISLYYVKELLGGENAAGLASEAVKIFDKILEKLPRLSRDALFEVKNMIKIAPLSVQNSDIVDADVFDIVQGALSDKKSIDFIYTTFYNGETKSRRFDPYILEVNKGSWHMIGYCHLRNCVRDFRLSRIKEAIITDNKFTVPPKFYEEYKKTRFDALAGGEPVCVRIEFRNVAAKIVKEYHKNKADFIEDMDGLVIFNKKAGITADFIQWILSFGDDALVLEPASLARQIADIAERMRARYINGEDNGAKVNTK